MVVWLGLLFTLLAVDRRVVFSQPSGEEILKNVSTHFPGVQDYSVTLDIASDIERLNVPPMNVRMYFKQPDKYHFESEGFAMLPKEGLAFNPTRFLTRFTIDEVMDDSIEGKAQLRLLMHPKEERARSTKVVLSVDPVRWKPTRIVTSLFDGRTMTATFHYGEQGGHLMPVLLTVQFVGPATDTTEQNSGSEEMAPVQRPRMPRKGTVTIRYSNYEIDTGLSDDIFKKQ